MTTFSLSFWSSQHKASIECVGLVNDHDELIAVTPDGRVVSARDGFMLGEGRYGLTDVATAGPGHGFIVSDGWEVEVAYGRWTEDGKEDWSDPWAERHPVIAWMVDDTSAWPVIAVHEDGTGGQPGGVYFYVARGGNWNSDETPTRLVRLHRVGEK